MTDLDKIAIMLEAGSPECACMKCEECPPNEGRGKIMTKIETLGDTREGCRQ